MNKILIASALLGASSFAQSHSNDCHLSTDFDINIDESTVMFKKTDDSTIEFKSDQLFINGESISLNAEQKEAANALQVGARQMVPKIASIAVDGAELGIKASTMVLSSLFGDDKEAHKDLIAPIEAITEKIKLNISETSLNTSELEKTFESAFDEEFEQLIEQAALKYSGKMIGNIFSVIFSGDDEELEDLEFRMENLERDIEKYVEANAKDIEQRAESLCGDIAALEKFDSILESVQGYPTEGIIQTEAKGLNVKGFTWNN